MNCGNAFEGAPRFFVACRGTAPQPVGAGGMDRMKTTFLAVGVTFSFDDGHPKVIQFLQAVLSNKMDRGFLVR